MRPNDLGAFIVRTLFDRVGGGVEANLDEVICGCRFPWGEQGYNVGRTIGLLARLEKDVPAFSITRLCASSLQAIRSAQHAIQVGEGTSYAIVGIGSCSRVGRDRHLAEHNPLLDPHMPGPTIADVYFSMIETAENVASKYGVSRHCSLWSRGRRPRLYGRWSHRSSESGVRIIRLGSLGHGYR